MTVRTRAGLAIATALGAGYAPIAPGTFGSAVGLLLWIALPHVLWIQLVVILIVAVVGSWSGTVAEEYFNRQDPGEVVVDEVAGMMVTLVLAPVGGFGWMFFAFLLFRAFDIVKPFPVRHFERLPGGIGIMADDLAAGVYANAALRACIWLFGHLVIWSLSH